MLLKESINGYFFYDIGDSIYVVEDSTKKTYEVKKEDIFSEDPNWDVVEKLIDICYCEPDEIKDALIVKDSSEESGRDTMHYFMNGVIIVDTFENDEVFTRLIDLEDEVYELDIESL